MSTDAARTAHLDQLIANATHEVELLLETHRDVTNNAGTIQATAHICALLAECATDEAAAVAAAAIARLATSGGGW